MAFHNGPIEGVTVRPIRKWLDERGWLAELFRSDELDSGLLPTMSYVSATAPGVLRGPHEHVEQADLFGLFGPGNFKVTLWDNRAGSPTYRSRMELFLGGDNPATLLVPPGVVHCYRCIGGEPGLVFNAPNRLYAGPGRKDPVDEIRHEQDPESPFVKDELARRARLA